MKTSLLAFVLIFSQPLFAQEYEWKALPNAPLAGRHDDMQWITPDYGYVANSTGQIWKTTDGGNSWTKVMQDAPYFRSMAFTDSLNGWAGTLNSVSTLFHTSDGGKNWTLVNNLPVPKPKRICGMSVVNHNVIYGSGAFDGPPVIIKTINSGQSWTSIDMSAYAQTLVDIKFFSADTGIVIGGGLTGQFSYSNPTINSVVLYTTNGGESWTPVFTGTIAGEWGWKIFFVNRKVGYVSLEDFGKASVLKTTDGGLNWTRYIVDGNHDIEGIGFENEMKGWVGGYGFVSQTLDGGKTWQDFNFAGGNESLDRFYFFGDSIGYAAGKTIYKYSKKINTTVQDRFVKQNRSPLLLSNYPNPFNPETTISYRLPKGDQVKIRLFNSFGQEIRLLFEGFQPSGDHKIKWDGKENSGYPASSGVYYYRIDSGDISESKTMVMVK